MERDRATAERARALLETLGRSCYCYERQTEGHSADWKCSTCIWEGHITATLEAEREDGRRDEFDTFERESKVQFAIEEFREAAYRTLLSNERLKELVGVNERAWVASLIRTLPGREG